MRGPHSFVLGCAWLTLCFAGPGAYTDGIKGRVDHKIANRKRVMVSNVCMLRLILFDSG